ncbi:MAG: NADH-quinone oxidoreductase subunit L [Bacillota bacterium]
MSSLASLSLWVIALPFVGAAAVALLGNHREKAVSDVALGTAILDSALAVLLVTRTGSHSQVVSRWKWPFDFALVSDGLSVFAVLVTAAIGALILVYSRSYMEHEHGKALYYALMLSVIGAMNGLSLSGSLLYLYVFWAVCAIASFSLIAFHRDDPVAKAAAKRAYLFTGLCDLCLIAGVISLYMASTPATFDLATIAEGIRSGAISASRLTFPAFAMLIGAMGRSAQAPLHLWLPGAMEAPSSASALIDAAATLNGGVILMARLYPAFSAVPGWAPAVLWIGTVTVLWGAVAAMRAQDLKRMLGYSTMSQLGYMFMAIGTGSVLASQFHMVSHAVFKSLLFLAAGAVVHEAGTRDMRLLSGAGKKMPFTGRMFMLGVMGLSGIPLTSGFFSKDMVFAGALHAHVYPALAGAVLGAALTFTYSWRAYLRVFGGEPSVELASAHEAPRSMAWPMGVLGLGTLCSWLLIGLQSEKIHETVAGMEVHVLTPAYLVEETFASPAALLSALALALGLAAVVFMRRVSRAGQVTDAATKTVHKH